MQCTSLQEQMSVQNCQQLAVAGTDKHTAEGAGQPAPLSNVVHTLWSCRECNAVALNFAQTLWYTTGTEPMYNLHPHHQMPLHGCSKRATTSVKVVHQKDIKTAGLGDWTCATRKAKQQLEYNMVSIWAPSWHTAQ